MPSVSRMNGMDPVYPSQTKYMIYPGSIATAASASKYQNYMHRLINSRGTGCRLMFIDLHSWRLETDLNFRKHTQRLSIVVMDKCLDKTPATTMDCQDSGRHVRIRTRSHMRYAPPVESTRRVPTPLQLMERAMRTCMKLWAGYLRRNMVISALLALSVSSSSGHLPLNKYHRRLPSETTSGLRLPSRQLRPTLHPLFRRHLLQLRREPLNHSRTQ
jgi:hypothetical protein